MSSWCLVIIVWLFLAVPWVCLQFVIEVFPDHTYLLFFTNKASVLIQNYETREDPALSVIITTALPIRRQSQKL